MNAEQKWVVVVVVTEVSRRQALRKNVWNAIIRRDFFDNFHPASITITWVTDIEDKCTIVIELVVTTQEQVEAYRAIVKTLENRSLPVMDHWKEDL